MLRYSLGLLHYQRELEHRVTFAVYDRQEQAFVYTADQPVDLVQQVLREAQGFFGPMQVFEVRK